MSTPLFAPGISTQLPIHHMNSFNPSATPSSNHPTTTSHPSEPLTSKASSPPAPPTTSVNSNSTASPHSSRCSTSSSSADSLSPDSEALTCSSILGGGPGGRNSGDGGEGTGSVATTASPGSFVEAGSKGKGGVEEEVADEGGKLLERRESEGGPMEIAELSVRDESTPMVEDREGEDEEETTPEGSSSRDRLVVDGGNGGDGIAQTGAGGGKMRRASTLSSSSSSTQQTSPSGEENFQNGTTTTSSNSDWRPSGGKAGSDPSKPARRKAARLGSFEGKQREDEAMVDDDGEADNEAETPSTGKTEEKKAATTVPVASNSRPPSTVDKTPSARRPDPTPPQPPTPSSTKHVDIVSFPSAELLRLLASLLEQIAHANDALHQRSRSTSSSRPGSGTNTPALTGLTPSNTNGNNNEENEASFQSGRFVAAPLNSPVAPTSANRRGMSTVQDAEEGDESTTTQEEQEEMPVTPGVDLLREVGAAGGVEGFMPSLGGSHTPIPLGRRRGSSFMKRRDDSAPVLSRRSSAVPSGTATPSTPSTSNNNNTSSISTTSTSTNTSTTNPPQPSASSEPLTSLLTASSEALSGPAATLCFHARNVPAISIEAYLLRILKYCPTTNEVFLSLLVYFDRMARVGLEAQRMGLSGGGGGNGGGSPRGGSSGGGGGDGSRLFAIDSFNVHRLVIAGVTVASKFFSDVFYTNSRYAKVGGLPLHELNQLELQFLLLNDFRLVIPLDELQRYADQLILFWVGRNPSTGVSSHPHPATNTTTAAALASPAVTPAAVAARTSSSSSQSTPYTPTAPTSTSSAASFSSSTSSNRPRSIRSQPSSSGTSVTSTITPGTPSTPRQEIGSESEDQGNEDGVGGWRGRGAEEEEEEERRRRFMSGDEGEEVRMRED